MDTRYTAEDCCYVDFREQGEDKRRNCSRDVMRAFDARMDKIQHALGTAHTKQAERNALARYARLVAWLRKHS